MSPKDSDAVVRGVIRKFAKLQEIVDGLKLGVVTPQQVRQVREYITHEEAAKEADVEVSTVTKWFRQGKFKGALKSGLEILIPVDTWEVFMRDR